MSEAEFADRSPAPSPAARLFPGRYLSVTSYKRDGTGVATPVWFVQRDGRLLVETDAASGKVKRIKRNPAVLVAACTASGRIRGEQADAVAELLPGSEVAGIETLIARKYRVDVMFIKPLRIAQSALHLGRPRTTPVILAITPEGVPS